MAEQPTKELKQMVSDFKPRGFSHLAKLESE